MKRILAGALLALTSACTLLPTDSSGKLVPAGEDFTLAEGQTALVREPRVAVRFLEVTEDSRCPIEADCITAGNATVRLRVSQEGFEPAILDLRTDEPLSREVYNYYAVELLGLDPARSIRVENPDYVVHLRVYGVPTFGG
jgi:hypothetical protein